MAVKIVTWVIRRCPGIAEHVLVGDVLRTLWKRDVTDVEILRPEFDAHGYDVVMNRGPIVRRSCVVWIGLNKDRAPTLE